MGTQIKPRPCVAMKFTASAVTSLKFGFQGYSEPRKIDKIPAREFPHPIHRACLVLESNDEMHRVVAHFIRALPWLEIKGAETTVAAPRGIKFWVQIEHAFALRVDDAQVRIT